MVNPVHLRTLLEVTRRGSFAAAAAQLGYTASAVSQQMAALERETGVVLFERSARAAHPTAAAAVMSRHAAKVLTDLEALLAAASQTPGTAAEELRLGIFPSLATYVLPRVLQTTAWKDMRLGLSLRVGEPAQTIQGLRGGGELDIALVYQVGQSGLAWPHTLNRKWVADDVFRVVLPASWGIREGSQMSASQLTEMPWIMHHPGTPDATVIERLFASCNLHPQVVAYSDDFNASLALSAAGLGASLVPELVLRHSKQRFVVVDVPEIRLARTVFALMPQESPAAKNTAAAQSPARKNAATLGLFVELLGTAFAEAIARD
ncbi:DNA-binding transcriptional LysR family regulator [Psychromicrobium silvestre]|uniref:DNA-binding transcriptional LysR family regulator n=1 Tax=Psychromicrobium silvestre TaxID=1645614 RepID=A0A7Y9S681_9MICC|nr:LysR family transcriptional regulator [Psychromicrobium silvestre]NYE94461.1 DNA-binding transcriptional LysR family regulator [Psychromicrobium silvestre]